MQMLSSARDVISLVPQGARVFVHGSAATPVALCNALLDRAGELRNIELAAISTVGALEWNRPEVLQHFRLASLFVSANVRSWVDGPGADYIPVFLSDIPALFRGGEMPIDVALLHLSPPDRHGFCSLGTSVDAALAAAQTAKLVLAQINPNMPRTLGDSHVHVSKIHAACAVDAPLPQVSYAAEATAASKLIGHHVAGLVEDRATLQMGIGAVPDAVLRCLTHHKDLGVHTEMFSDGVIDLVERGVVTNAHKKVEPGKLVSAFVLGTQRTYDFVHDNPQVSLRDVAFVNDTAVIRKNTKVVAINSAIQIDLTGQVCADSIGTHQYSGIGGQMDFMRGAALSEGGKAIIAMPSTTRKGISRIVPTLTAGAGVVTTRGHIQYVATEHGVVNLRGKGLEERARLLISIAAPEAREALERAYRERFRHST